MRELLVVLIIFSGLITTFIAYMFTYEPSQYDNTGRSVVSEFGVKNELHISRFGNQFIVSDISFSNSKFPYFFDAYEIKYKCWNSYLYLLCKDNMIVLDENNKCILFFSMKNIESEVLIKHMKKYYTLDDSKVVYHIDELDEIDKSIYKFLQRQKK